MGCWIGCRDAVDRCTSNEKRRGACRYEADAVVICLMRRGMFEGGGVVLRYDNRLFTLRTGLIGIDIQNSQIQK